MKTNLNISFDECHRQLGITLTAILFVDRVGPSLFESLNDAGLIKLAGNLEKANIWSFNPTVCDPVESPDFFVDGPETEKQIHRGGQFNDNLHILKNRIATEVKERKGNLEYWADLMDKYYSPFWFHNHKIHKKNGQKKWNKLELAVLSKKKS